MTPTPWHLPLFAAGLVCLAVVISIPLALLQLARRLPGSWEYLNEAVFDLAGCYADALDSVSPPGRK